MKIPPRGNTLLPANQYFCKDDLQEALATMSEAKSAARRTLEKGCHHHRLVLGARDGMSCCSCALVAEVGIK